MLNIDLIKSQFKWRIGSEPTTPQPGDTLVVYVLERCVSFIRPNGGNPSQYLRTTGNDKKFLFMDLHRSEPEIVQLVRQLTDLNVHELRRNLESTVYELT